MGVEWLVQGSSRDEQRGSQAGQWALPGGHTTMYYMYYYHYHVLHHYHHTTMYYMYYTAKTIPYPYHPKPCITRCTTTIILPKTTTMYYS